MDLERELMLANTRIGTKIEILGMRAVSKLYWMHAVGSGICYCGDDYEGHETWGNHSPVEMPIDKGYADDWTNYALPG